MLMTRWWAVPAGTRALPRGTGNVRMPLNP